MTTVKPVEFVTPDGVSRQLRFTQGAKKRIVDRLGMSMHAALEKYDSGAFPEILFAMMHDARGNPPADLTAESLAEMMPINDEDSPPVLAAIMSSATQGQTTKNELEPVIRKEMEARRLEEMKKMGLTNGLIPGPFVPARSDSPTDNSGGDTSNVKSSLESNNTDSSSESGTSDLPVSTPQSAT